MRTLFYVSLSLFFLICSLSVAYYLVIFLPDKELKQLEFQKTSQKDANIVAEQKANELKTCLTRAQEIGSEFWNRECESQGLKEDCRLPHENAERIDNSIKDSRDLCLKLYPQN